MFFFEDTEKKRTQGKSDESNSREQALVDEQRTKALSIPKRGVPKGGKHLA